METPTQPGGETSESAAVQKILSMGLLDAETPSEPPKEEPSTEPEATESADAQQETEEVKEEPEAEAEAEATEEKTEEDALASIQSLDELAEGLNTTPDRLTQLNVKVKIDGEERTVKLGDVVKSYQLEGYLNKQNMELANQRKSWEAESSQSKQELSAKLETANKLTEYIENQLMQDYQNIDWNKIRQESPADYAALKADYNERFAQVQALKTHVGNELATERASLTEKQQKAFQSFIEGEKQKLTSAIPEWSDPVKKAEGTKELTSYLQQFLSQEEIGNIVDHRAIVMARKAMLYDKMSGNVSAKEKKVTTLPKFVKPGAKQTKTDAKNEAHKQKLKALQKSGGTDKSVAIDIFKDFL